LFRIVYRFIFFFNKVKTAGTPFDFRKEKPIGRDVILETAIEQ
jgi:hypothetical protein